MSLEKEKTLNALKRKKRIGIALIIVLTLAFGGFLTWRVDNVASRYEMESRTMGMRVLDDIIVHELMATRDLKENYALKAELNGIETVCPEREHHHGQMQIARKGYNADENHPD